MFQNLFYIYVSFRYFFELKRFREVIIFFTSSNNFMRSQVLINVKWHKSMESNFKSRNFKNASFTTKKSIKSSEYPFMKLLLQYFILPFIALLSMHIIIVFYNIMNPLLSIIIFVFYYQSFAISYLLLICGNIHPNPGPKDFFYIYSDIYKFNTNDNTKKN